MPSVRVFMDDEAYAKLKKMRTAMGASSLAEVMLKRCDLLSDAANAEEMVRTALQRVGRRKPGEIFELKDLFPQNWESKSPGVRRRAGKLFITYAKTGTHGFFPSHKSSDNHQHYRVGVPQPSS